MEKTKQLEELQKQYEETKKFLMQSVTVNGNQMMFSSLEELEIYLDNYKLMVISDYKSNKDRIEAMEQCGNEPMLSGIKSEIKKLEDEINASS